MDDRQTSQSNLNSPPESDIRNAAEAELFHIRRLGSSPDLLFASINAGAYEALLIIIAQSERGSPVYQVLQNVQTRYSTATGILGRLRAMRELGLLETRPGEKRSQVCLVPSERLLKQLGPVLLRRSSDE